MNMFTRTFIFNFNKVIRQPFLTDRLVIKLREKENILHCVYLNEFKMCVAAFALQCNEAKNWYEGINKARHIYMKLKQDLDASVKILPHQQGMSNNYSNNESICIKKSPLGSSIGKYLTFVRNLFVSSHNFFPFFCYSKQFQV